MKKIKFLGNTVFLLTIISPVVAFVIAASVGEAEIFGVGGIVRYSWVMLTFLPVGILSVVIGAILKKRNEGGLKNIVVACICVPILLIFGSYRFIFNNFTYDEASITYIEEFASINLPSDMKIVTNDMNAYVISYAKINSQEEKIEFEQNLKNDYKWEKKLDSQIMNALPFNIKVETEGFDYFTFYSNLGKEYNSISVGGEHECIYIAYDSETGRFAILSKYIVEWS